MKIIYFCSLLLLLTPLVCAQSDTNTDSLTYQIAQISEAEISANPTAAQKKLIALLAHALPDTSKALGMSLLGMAYGYGGDWEKALATSKKSHQLYQQTLGDAHKSTIDELYNIGFEYGVLDHFDSLLICWEACVNRYNAYHPTAYFDLGLVHNNLGTNCRSRGLPLKTLHHFRKTVEYWEKVKDEYPEYLMIGYENLGANLKTKEAIYYLQKALNLRKKNGENPYRSYIELAGKYTDLEQYDLAFAYYEKGVTLLKPLVAEQKPNTYDYQWDLAMTYRNIAAAYYASNNMAQTVAFYDKALAMPTIQYYDYKRVELEAEKARALAKLNQHEQAKRMLHQAVQEATQKQLRTFSVPAKLLSRYYQQQQQFEQAIHYNTVALRYLSTKICDTTFQEQPQVFQYEKVPQNTQSAVLLSDRAFYFYQLSQSKADEVLNMLHRANEQVEQAILLFEALRENTTDFIGFRRQFDDVIELQQLILSALYAEIQDETLLHLAFESSEKNKISRALLTLNSQQDFYYGGDFQELRQENMRIGAAIAHLKAKIFTEEQQLNQADTVQIATWHDQIFAYHQQQQTLVAKLRVDYPDYYQLKYDIKPVSVAHLQRQLDTETAMLVYSYAAQHLFTYVITQKGITMHQRDFGNKFDDFVQHIMDYQRMLHTPTSNLKKMEQVGTRLMQYLLPEGSFSALNKYKQLIFVPDKLLGTIPYELFWDTSYSTPEKSFKNLPYLLRTHEISYASSATLWTKQLAQKQAGAEAFWAGFAPSYEGYQVNRTDTTGENTLAILVRDGLFELPGAKQEVMDIAQMVDGKTFVGKQATKQNFKDAAGEYSILHLAMHTLLENQQPLFSKFLFSQSDTNHTLTVSELYNLPLKTDLAVLSACNTGIGKIMPGEGMQSLSHAFTVAGCPATIMTLWSVPDQESTILMKQFYTHLKEGKSKRTALTLAKRDYLDQVNDRLAHPYFWAGFVLSGNPTPIALQTNYWLWGIGLLAGVVAVFLVMKRKK